LFQSPRALTQADLEKALSVRKGKKASKGLKPGVETTQEGEDVHNVIYEISKIMSRIAEQ
jgi:hypothetical protein